MNGIKFTDYSDFTKKWKLVTVRFRADSKEMRFTYANDLAWKDLKSIKPNYADGAIFAKVSLITEEDPAFPSSKVPSGSKRYQYMVRDKKKYKESDGWGYALFDADGNLFNEDIKQKTMACAACHRIVPERDFVFSRELHLDPFSKKTLLPEPTGGKAQIHFIPRPAAFFGLSSPEKSATKEKDFESLEGNLQKNTFSGTFDEVVPLLVDQAKKMSRNSIFFLNQQNYSLVKLVENGKPCAESANEKLFAISVIFNGKKVRDVESCL